MCKHIRNENQFELWFQDTSKQLTVLFYEDDNELIS